MIAYSSRLRIQYLTDKIQDKVDAILDDSAIDPKHEQRQLLMLTRKLRDEIALVYRGGMDQ